MSRLLAISAAFLLSAGLLFAHGQAENKAATSGAKSVKLVETDWYTGFQAQVTNAALQKYEEAHPGVTVQRIEIPNSQYYQKITTMIAGGTPPNTSNFGPEAYAPFVAQGALVNLLPYAQKSGFSTNDFEPVALKQWNIAGKQYGFPQSNENTLIYYNKVLFKKAGLEYPTNNWTWKQFLNDAERLTVRQDGQTSQWGFEMGGLGGFTNYTALTWIYSNGGRQFNNSATKCLVNSPQSVAALQFAQDLLYKYKVAPTSLVQPEPVETDAQLFINGKAAMMLEGSWAVGTDNLRKRMTDSWNVVLPPRGPDGAGGKYRVWLKSGGGFVMFTNGANPHQTWNFVKYLSGLNYSNNAMIAPGIGFPPRMSQIDSNVYIHQGQPPAAVSKDFFLSLGKLQRYQAAAPHVLPLDVRNAFNAFDAVSLGQKPAAVVADSVAKEVNAMLSK